jgi:hypothetical protein
MALKTDAMIVAGIAVALLVAGYYIKKKVGDVVADVADTVSQAWDSAAETAGHAGDVVIAKPVLGIGDAIGLPRTNETECERAKREGRTWDASFACPASDFLSYVWN